MNIGAIVTGFFAVGFTLGALLLPFVIRKVIDTTNLSRLRVLGLALYAFIGTMGLAFFAVLSTVMLCGYIDAAESTFWYAFLGQTLAMGGNLFYWFSRRVQYSY